MLFTFYKIIFVNIFMSKITFGYYQFLINSLLIYFFIFNFLIKVTFFGTKVQ